MPETTPTAFVQLKHMFRDAALAMGDKLSSRDQHRFAQAFMLRSAADGFDQPYADGTGEEAVRNVLVEYIKQFGSLRRPDLAERKAA